MNCLFCKIINKEINSAIIHEDDKILVFLDINPKANGHMLIIPKKHYLDIADININILNHINKTSKEMHQLLINKLKIDGLTIIQNNGSAQEVKHYHLHLIPKYNKAIPLTVDEVYQILTT